MTYSGSVMKILKLNVGILVEFFNKVMSYLVNLMRINFFVNIFAMSSYVVLCLFASLNVASAFMPNETQVSKVDDLIDPEYDQGTFQFTWADRDGNLWIGKLDAEGMFDPPSGKAILVDANAMNTSDLVYVTFNGPEWIQTAEGPQIVYTKFPANQVHTSNTARIALARRDLSGNWGYKFLYSQKFRNCPYGSADIGDVAPRITYIDSKRNHYWCEINNTATEELIPLIKPSLRALRWVQNARIIVFPAPSPTDNIQQVFLYNIDTKALEQITFDSGNKHDNAPCIWQAPEYNNEYVLFTVVNGSEIRIYRKMADNNGHFVWTIVHSTTAPLNSRIGSAEVFTYNGHSYIFMVLTIDGNPYPTSVWLANIDPEKPFFRKISDDTLFRWRTDPEVFITAKGPYIYYNRKKAKGQGVLYTEGIFRASCPLSQDD